MTTPKFTAEDRATLSENSRILLAMWEAEDRGDQAEADRLLSALEGPAHALMAIKTSFPGGADWIREMNLNTRLADEKYGLDWLDRNLRGAKFRKPAILHQQDGGVCATIGLINALIDAFQQDRKTGGCATKQIAD